MELYPLTVTEECYRRANAYCRGERGDIASEEYEKAIEVDKKNVETYYSRGLNGTDAMLHGPDKVNTNITKMVIEDYEKAWEFRSSLLEKGKKVIVAALEFVAGVNLVNFQNVYTDEIDVDEKIEQLLLKWIERAKEFIELKGNINQKEKSWERRCLEEIGRVRKILKEIEEEREDLKVLWGEEE